MTAKPTTKPTSKTSSGKTLDEFQAAHDESFVVPNKIKEGLKSLGKGCWEYEGEFIRRCGVAFNQFAHYRDEFSDYCLDVGASGRAKRVWAGSKELAQKMREMVQ